MARTLVESPVTTRASRALLAKGTHWRGIDKDIHLGYRKSRRGGVWLVRWYTHRNRCYQRIDLGVADDVLDEGTLDFNAAIKAAKAAVTKARQKIAADAAGPVLTVRLAVEQYVAARTRDIGPGRGGRSARTRQARSLDTFATMKSFSTGGWTN